MARIRGLGQRHVYTAENHLTFLHEILQDDRMSISVGLVDFSEKAAHLSFEMYNAVGTLCAHHETLVFHVRKDPKGVPYVCPFDPAILEALQQSESDFGRIRNSKYCGNSIGIRK